MKKESMKTFAEFLSDNIHLKPHLMKDFELAESSIDRWAKGIDNPHPLLKTAICSFIVEADARSEIVEELQVLRLQLVSKIINKYDPAGLIKKGAPEDEYRGEVEAIVRHFAMVNKLEDLTQVVWSIFVVDFGLGLAGSMDYYQLIARELWEVRNIRREEIVVNKAVNKVKDTAMLLGGEKVMSLAKGGLDKVKGWMDRKKS